MNDWKVVFDEAAFEFFLGLKLRERHILLKAFATLKSNPYERPDFNSSDTTGRPLNVRGFRPFLITYWLDHAVKEVRVLEIQRIVF